MQILAWIFSDRWDLVWQGSCFTPLLGIIFLPYTTVIYMLSNTPGFGITGWDWMWIARAVVLDIWKWAGIAKNRRLVTGYPQEAWLGLLKTSRLRYVAARNVVDCQS